MQKIMVNGKKQADKPKASSGVPLLGITGTGGAGKSSVTDEIVRRYLNAFPEKTIAVISVDPPRKNGRRPCWATVSV